MKCKHCGADIIRIVLGMGGKVVCNAAPVTYWAARDNDAVTIYTPNGERLYGNLTGDLNDAVGIGYRPHTCFEDEEVRP